MHFHLPKPLHGWREFAGEVGIIVIGVLIALCAEQLVERVHWRDSADAVQSAMDHELAADRSRWDRMMESQPCAERQLLQLDAWSRTAPPKERLNYQYGPDFSFSHTSAWEMAKSGDILSHVPLSRRLAYSGLYDHLALMQQWISLDAKTWADIGSVLTNSDDPAARRELRRIIYQARVYDDALKQNYKALNQEFDRLGIAPERGLKPKSLAPVCPALDRSSSVGTAR